MAAAGRLRQSIAVKCSQTQGLLRMAGYAWLLALLSTANGAFPILGGRTLPPPVDKWFYNGTYASATCTSKFGCGTKGSNVPECSCHLNCSLFDECCEDIRPTNWRQLQLPPDSYECKQMFTADDSRSTGVNATLTAVIYSYVITKCPPGVVSSIIRNFCEKPSIYLGNDTLPLVTDNITGLTYANEFCATCHGIQLSRRVNWPARNVCLEVQALELTGCQQRWIKPKDLAELADCTGPYVKSCPANAPPWIQDACTYNPVKRIYDKTNKVAYRNYNCSLCYPITNQSWSCTQWSTGFGAGIEVGLEVLLAVYSCPKQLKAFLTDDEKRIWSNACPGINFDMGNCSDTRSMTDLSLFYNSNPADDYDITSEGVWVRYNDSYTVCASCNLANYSAAMNNYETYSSSDNITVNGTTYLLPFFKVVDGGHVAVCIPRPSYLPTGKCTDLPGVVSQVLMALSLLGLTLYAVAYGILQSLQNLPGQIVLHQSVAFFAAFIFFMVRAPAGIVSDGACIALGVLSHFFFLAAFTWTAVYAIEVVRALGLQAYGAGFTKRRLRYIIVGWLVPALIMIAAIATDWSTLDNGFRPAYGRPQCFINSEYGQRIFFTAPLAFFLLIDVVIYVYVIVKLIIISSQTKMVREAHHEKLFLVVKLVFALGITWIFAVLAAATGDCILVYIFELMNSLQGVFVFLIFVCNAKTSGQIHKKVMVQKSFISSTGAGATLSTRDSSSSGTSILSKRKSVLGVHSFSPVSLAMDAHEHESNPPR